MNRGRIGEWYNAWIRTGKLPDGRRAYSVNVTAGGPYACFEPEITEREKKGLPIPWPGDPPTKEGYAPKWERIEVSEN